MNNGSPASSPVSQVPPHVGSGPNSPALAPNMDSPAPMDPDAPKYFFQEKYAPLNVKGNFLTLCACPKNVELGEWLAHQSKRSTPVPPPCKRIRTCGADTPDSPQSSNNTVCCMACSR